MPELEKMAEVNGWTLQQTHDKLKEYYDGYHFSRNNMVDIYNPFSLINALNSKNLANFWAASGATSRLHKFITNAELSLGDFDNCRVLRNILETSDVTGVDQPLFLYQSGYLHHQGDCDEFGYVLGFPNEEVKQALYETVLPSSDYARDGRHPVVAYQSVYAVRHRAVAGCDEVIEVIGCRCLIATRRWLPWIWRSAIV